MWKVRPAGLPALKIKTNGINPLGERKQLSWVDLLKGTREQHMEVGLLKGTLRLLL